MRVLVTGVTGYVGGRLVPRLLEGGHEVRVLVRDLKRLEGRDWARDVEIVEGGVDEGAAVARAVEGMDAAFYLVHSMCEGVDSFEIDRKAALTFSEAAQGLPQVIYLGGILPASAGRAESAHLWSMAEIGEILAARLPTTEIRVGPIVGSGSAFFEMVKNLTERLPVMIGPNWILNRIRPIAINDVLSYLVATLGRHDTRGVVEVGAMPLTFRKMLLQYAELRGLHRAFLPLPVRASILSGLWIALFTPIPNCLAMRLVHGMARPVVGDTGRGKQLFPDIRPMSFREAVKSALERIEEQKVQTRWSDALGQPEPYRLEEGHELVREVQSRFVNAPREAVFETLSSLGGDQGWLVWNWAWRLRGLMDKLVGGPGLRRGRRDPLELLPGDAVDFWRVEEFQPPRLLRLRAEMKVPGRAWLQWETKAEGGRTHLIQSALFEPHGLFGWAYWYASYPFHGFIFNGMVDAIADMAMARMEKGGPEPSEKVAI
jgi:uncharacterized protein YbjT (DUF2867 family)